MTYHLLIDDLRNFPDMDYTARTPCDGLSILYDQNVTHLYLDNDLGEEYREGWEILKYAINDGVCPDFVQLVTSNPVARERMGKMLFDEGFSSITGINFNRKG